jgi:hypothetical protein
MRDLETYSFNHTKQMITIPSISELMVNTLRAIVIFGSYLTLDLMFFYRKHLNLINVGQIVDCKKSDGKNQSFSG